MLFFQEDFWFKIFFAENIWVQIWLIAVHMDLQPDNTYLEKVAESGYMGFTFGKNSFWTTHQKLMLMLNSAHFGLAGDRAELGNKHCVGARIGVC